MRCKFLGVKGTWNDVLNSARTTVNKDPISKEPTSEWKRKILLAEHSPIRQIIIKGIWGDLKYFVSVHITRHWLGIVHFVRSQRTDRTGISRDDLPQGALIEHEVEANAQAIINISRKRLCVGQVSPETREAWQAFLDSFKDTEPELYSVCVRECVYRGFCPEMKTCKYNETKEYQQKLEEYRKC